MASVELRPGDTLNIVWSSVQDTPLGTKEVESSFAFSYEELLQRLKARGQAGKSRRSGTVGAKFSRFVALATNAIRKGKWSTGADIDKGEVFVKLLERLAVLSVYDAKDLTENARQSLVELYDNKSTLDQAQRSQLKLILDTLSISVVAS